MDEQSNLEQRISEIKSRLNSIEHKKNDTSRKRYADISQKKLSNSDTRNILLCENKWPEIGKANRYVFEEALAEQRNGAKLILWTNREGKLLEEAIEFCSFFGLHFDAVNESLPDWIEHFGSDPRKIGATEYWDDKAVRKEYKPMNKLATGGLVTGGINFGYQEPLTKAMEDA